MLRSVGAGARATVPGHPVQSAMVVPTATVCAEQRVVEEVRLTHLSSPMFLCSVHVLIALTLGKYGAIDRSADPKGKLQLTVF